MTNLQNKLNKSCKTDDDNARISWIIAYITSFLYQSQTEWLATQFIVSMKALFRGWIVKHWGYLEKRQNNVIKSIHKIVVKQCVAFYSKAWCLRNEVFHYSENYRKCVIEWHTKLKEKIERENRPEMRKHVRKQEIDVEKCNNSVIRLWNIATWKMMKNTAKEKANDIRNYFGIR